MFIFVAIKSINQTNQLTSLFSSAVPPILSSFSGKTRTAMVNTTFNISCTFYGEPVPNITWRKISGTFPADGISSLNILSSNSSFTVVQSVLLFRTVRRTHHGVFKCSAENSAGSREEQIELNVICKLL